MGYLFAPQGSSLLTAERKEADRAVLRPDWGLIPRALRLGPSVRSAVPFELFDSVVDGLGPVRHR